MQPQARWGATVSMSLALGAAVATASVVTIVGDRVSLVVSAAIAGTLSFFLLSIALRTRMSLNPHNVALIGFQQSGKTTLLITMLNELLLFRVSKVSARLRGEKTIEQVTRYMKKIKLRQAVGSTTRGSQFPYEINIAQEGFFGRSFKMSFGDFPGERSKEYVSELIREESEHYGRVEKRSVGERSLPEEDDAALFDGEFFRWVLECDALIFVVDVAQYLSSKARRQEQAQLDDYAVEVSQAYIRTWSYIVDARREGGEAREPIVVLAFTKSDLFDVDPEKSKEESLEATMATLGFEEPLPEVREISRLRFEQGSRQCKKDFEELIDFLKGHSRTFHAVYASSLALMDKRRLGVERLFKAVLPI